MEAQAGELLKGLARHGAQADDGGAVAPDGGPELAGLPAGGGAVHRHGPKALQPRQRPAAHLRQIPPREHCVRVEEQQRRAVRPLEHHRLTVKELSHIPHQAQQRPRPISPSPWGHRNSAGRRIIWRRFAGDRLTATVRPWTLCSRQKRKAPVARTQRPGPNVKTPVL